MAERDGGADPNTRGGGSNNWKKRLGGEPSSFTARITALRAYVRKIIRPFFLLDIHTLSPHRSRFASKDDGGTLGILLSSSFIVCHGYRMHYWLFILAHSGRGRERKRESIHPGRSAQRLNRQIKYYDRQIHGNFVGERSIPDGLDISPPTIPIPEFFLQTISTQAIQLILRKLTFRLKKISRFNYRPAFRAAHLDPHTHTHIYTSIGS